MLRGQSRRDGAPLLITVTGRHAVDPARLAPSYALPTPGIAPLVGLARVEGQPFEDVLVEALPPGAVPAGALAPFTDVGALASLGRDLAQAVARARRVIDGVHPDLIYVTSDGAFVALVPRGPRFIASAAPQVSGPPSYALPFVPHESLILGRPSTHAVDAFAVCTSLFVIATGRHPFGADLGEILGRMASDQPEGLPGPLGDVLARGLVGDPVTRPSTLQLASWFGRIADGKPPFR